MPVKPTRTAAATWAPIGGGGGRPFDVMNGVLVKTARRQTTSVRLVKSPSQRSAGEIESPGIHRREKTRMSLSRSSGSVAY